MRRAVALVALSLAVAAPVVAAPAGSSIRDPKGDWVLPSADVVAARIVGAKARVTLEVDLAAAPDAAAQYSVSFHGLHPCDHWSAGVSGLGTPAQRAGWRRGSCPGSDPGLVGGLTVADTPVTVTVRGSTLVFSAPYALGVRRGLRITGMSAGAQTSPVFACTVGCFYGGDLASGTVSYVLR